MNYKHRFRCDPEVQTLNKKKYDQTIPYEAFYILKNSNRFLGGGRPLIHFRNQNIFKRNFRTGLYAMEVNFSHRVGFLTSQNHKANTFFWMDLEVKRYFKRLNPISSIKHMISNLFK